MQDRKLLALCVLLLSFPLSAQQDSAEQEQDLPVTETESEVEQIVLPSEPPAAFQEFDPSEEISEDLSVPFPVDI